MLECNNSARNHLKVHGMVALAQGLGRPCKPLANRLETRTIKWVKAHHHQIPIRGALSSPKASEMVVIVPGGHV
jgi:hypothetical protein